MKQDKARQIRRMFAGIAHRYDFLNHFLSFGADWHWRKTSAKRIAEKVTDSCPIFLDLCCGTGDFALDLSRFGTVVGCDFCRPMLISAREKTAKKKNLRHPVRFLEGDGLNLPFADMSFSAVTVAFGVRNYTDIRQGLEEIHRVLRPGGVAGVLEFSHPDLPIFKGIYKFYSHRVLPRLGRWISGRDVAYHYLPDSVDRFPKALEFQKIMGECGLIHTGFVRYTLGVATFHFGFRHSK